MKTKRTLRIEKVQHIEEYREKAKDLQDELTAALDFENQKQKNKKKNRGKKSSQYFVHEKILELIDLYIKIYEADQIEGLKQAQELAQEAKNQGMDQGKNKGKNQKKKPKKQSQAEESKKPQKDAENNKQEEEPK